MPTISHSPQSLPHGAPAYYLARPASCWITALHRQTRQLIPALTRRAQRLHLPRLADYKLEPMPRMRWYS